VITDRSDPRWSRPGTLLAAGILVFVAGRIVDLVWHATHKEFETAAQQVQAHAVLWAGVLLLLFASGRALRLRMPNSGYAAVFVAAVFYVGVATWHFWEHSKLRDPDLPHVLLLVANVAIFSGAIWTAWSARRRSARPVA
jgi:hypothetical protein